MSLKWESGLAQGFTDFAVHTGHLVKRQILIQQVWDGDPDFAFLASFQVMLLLVHRPHLEEKESEYLKVPSS